MKLVVGAPVADRDWSLPHWFECLAKQTRPPDEYCFVISERQPTPVHQTISLIRRLCPVQIPQLSYALDTTPFIPRHERSQTDPRYVFGDFAQRRNLLRRMVLKREPDLFLSLDTDVMLEDANVIDRLIWNLNGHDLAAPCLFLHPADRASECFNAANWAAGEPGSPERACLRVTPEQAAEGPQLVDIPMAAMLMHSRVLEVCRYAYHRQGEDMGFAQDLDRQRMRCLWDPGLEVRHVMSPEAL